MLVALAMPSLIANSLASGAVILLAGVLEDNTCWPKFQICVAESACMRLEGITLASVTTTRVEGEEEASRQSQSRDYRWVLQSLKLEQLQGWKEMRSGKLSSSLQPRVVSTCKWSKHSVRLSREALVSKRGPFKRAHWVLFKRARDCGWEGAPLECLALSKDISACWKGRIAVLRQNCFTSFLRWRWIGMKPARASILPVGEVWNAPRIQRVALYCITVRSNT